MPAPSPARQRAKKTGATRYFDAESPCKWHGPADRFTASARCCRCTVEANKARAAKRKAAAATV